MKTSASLKTTIPIPGPNNIVDETMCSHLIQRYVLSGYSDSITWRFRFGMAFSISSTLSNPMHGIAPRAAS
jgi:hypothetical protein